MKQVSVIIPVLRSDSGCEKLLEELPSLIPNDWEIVVSESNGNENRAQTLNEGVRKSKGEFLWFLHGDSRIDSYGIGILQKSILHYPEKLHYFKLRFYPNRFLMRINANGANLRSRLLNSPFGDQGLCIRRENFFKCGCFDETAPYGEDLLFVWTAQENGIRLNRLDAYLETSDRKYQKNGWLRITLLHQYLYWKLAVSHFWK
ncbi:glycosyltransferase [Leptospira kmetyi]|uniref:glycosyltransferase n=1 Tax=Leptospira kmetyi TaxID=408139 RepID=UPI001083D63D|nr:glycosyltransferase [Leptospira kmetyi]TGK16800.1 glycosyltransferase [Leptospira kmetyi]TGK33109.1 glycosyltransferase [Leptospira kmetyi]TGL70605.1 glycosyltransferase [Leptospira kmetyi]